MDYSLETVEEKLIHVKTHLWDLQQEQQEKRNMAMAYVLEHLTMIVDNARMQYLDEKAFEWKINMARPKRQFTDEDEQKMYEYALSGCQNGTIATLMCIPLTTLIRRFGSALREKRAERKYNLRKHQTVQSVHNPAMAIFLGKNELNQTDKQVIETKRPQAVP